MHPQQTDLLVQAIRIHRLAISTKRRANETSKIVGDLASILAVHSPHALCRRSTLLTSRSKHVTSDSAATAAK